MHGPHTGLNLTRAFNGMKTGLSRGTSIIKALKIKESVPFYDVRLFKRVFKPTELFYEGLQPEMHFNSF